jgi:flagellar motor protein MotB
VSQLSSALPLPSIGGPRAASSNAPVETTASPPAQGREAPEAGRAPARRTQAAQAARQEQGLAIQEIISGHDDGQQDVTVAQDGTPRPDPIAPGNKSMPTFRDTPPPSPTTTAPIRRATGQEKTYPNLATVPPRPQGLQTPDELRALRQRLEADRSQAISPPRVEPLRPGTPVVDPPLPTSPAPRRSETHAPEPRSAGSAAAAATNVVADAGRFYPEAGPAPANSPSPSASRGRSPSVSILAAWLSFANDSKRLSAEDRRIVREVAALYQKQGGRLRVVDEPQTQLAMDERRGRSRNETDRARDIAQELIRSGVNEKDVVVSAGDGGRDVLPPSRASAANERRVHIYLDY